MQKDYKSNQYRVEISLVKKLFDFNEERKIASVDAIVCLEQITGEDFKNTKDLRNNMTKFIDKHYYKGVDLRRARKASGMEQHELAEWFEVSKHRIVQMETNKIPLSEDAIAFIKVQGFKKTVPYKKAKKTVNAYSGMDNAKKHKIPPEKNMQKKQISDLNKQSDFNLNNVSYKENFNERKKECYI